MTKEPIHLLSKMNIFLSSKYPNKIMFLYLFQYSQNCQNLTPSSIFTFIFSSLSFVKFFFVDLLSNLQSLFFLFQLSEFEKNIRLFLLWQNLHAKNKTTKTKTKMQKRKITYNVIVFFGQDDIKIDNMPEWLTG